jgi:hypothetical protein
MKTRTIMVLIAVVGATLGVGVEGIRYCFKMRLCLMRAEAYGERARAERTEVRLSRRQSEGILTNLSRLEADGAKRLASYYERLRANAAGWAKDAEDRTRLAEEFERRAKACRRAAWVPWMPAPPRPPPTLTDPEPW